MKDWKLLAKCVGLAFLPSLSGAVTRPDATYFALNKPPLNPPPWVFAPVWATLYALMGWAHYEYLKTPSRFDKSVGTRLQVAQLVLNGTWSLAFFGLKSPKLALFNIVLMLVAIVATMRAFSLVSKRAMWLMLPYLLWVSFATYLNAAIVVLNRDA